MRLIIVAQNAIAAEAIRRELRYVSGCKVLGYVNARRPNAALVADARPDVIVIDDSGSRDDALACVREIRSGAADAKLVLVTTRMEQEWLAATAAAGVNAVVAKSVATGSLGLLIREVAAGNIFHAFASTGGSTQAAPEGATLTIRELEILRRVAGGASNGRIATDLWVTEQTVKFHLSNVYRKLAFRIAPRRATTRMCTGCSSLSRPVPPVAA